MTKAIAQTYTAAYSNRRTITIALMGMCLMAAAFYLANIYRVVSHGMAAQRVAEQIAATEASIRDLDGRYLSVSKSITPDVLRAHGFDKGEVTAFISRTASLGYVSSGYGF